MRKKFGKLMQAAGALLLFILACASDMGAVSVMGLAGGAALRGAAVPYRAAPYPAAETRRAPPHTLCA